MFRTQRTPTALVLVLLLSHAPVPWLHHHVVGNDRGLISHLRLFHPQADEDKPPKGWHVHLLPFEMLAGTDVPEHSALYFAESAPLQLGLPSAASSGNLTETLFAATPAGQQARLTSSLLRTTLFATESGLTEFYKLFSVLLL